MLSPVELTERHVRLLDQRVLPRQEVWLELETPEAVRDAIREMVVRGAPAIGITAAFGLALGAASQRGSTPSVMDRQLDAWFEMMAVARPTAVNLAWAVERMRRTAAAARAAGADNDALAARLEREARLIFTEDLAACREMGRLGAELVPQTARLLTHCNAGGLATAGYGTALGVVRGAIEAGKHVSVLADETRPFLQGSRLTAFELMRDGIETVLIADNAAASLMQRGEVDLVVVGSDRIAANGDVANKIGTYGVAVLAREHGIPFYVAAPLSTIDFDCADGGLIPIEEREASEVSELFGTPVAPVGVKVRNPAFDVTPARLVDAIITEHGIARAPYGESLAALRRTAERRGERDGHDPR